MLPIKIDFDLKSTAKDLAVFARSTVWADIMCALQQRVQDHYEQFVMMETTDPRLAALHAAHKECHLIVNMLLMLVEQNKETPDAESNPSATASSARDS